ncbi:MAG: hypothetical protein ABIS29_06730, partial [Vicinamibacterales bacterium]
AAAQRASDDNGTELRSIRDVLDALRGQYTVTTPVVIQLRDRQRQFFRLNQRFPECIDVGIRVWESMQDWHIRNLRPLNINRGGDGRWQMDFILTVLVLRHELPENEIGQPYDR